MTRLSSCPNCWRQVLVPPGAARRSRVRCPLCAAEFELQVLQEADLPELVLMDGAQAEHALAEEPAPADESGSRSSSDVLGVYRGGAGWGNEAREGEAPAERRIWEGEAREDEASAGPRIWESEAPPEPYAPLSAADDAWRTEIPPEAMDGAEQAVAEAAPEGGLAEGSDTGGMASSREDGSAGASPSQEPFNFYASPKTHDEGVPVEVAARQGKGREANMAIEMAKVVAGGFVGLVIAYGVLLVFFKRDPLNLADSLPRWMVPASMESDENGE